MQVRCPKNVCSICMHVAFRPFLGIHPIPFRSSMGVMFTSKNYAIRLKIESIILPNHTQPVIQGSI